MSSSRLRSSRIGSTPESRLPVRYGGILITMSEKVLHDLSTAKKWRVFLILVVITSVFLAGCYPVTRSKGVIRDPQGQPVANATVKIAGKSAKPEELKTPPDGTFDFGDIEIISHQDPIEIELTVEKEGFNKFSKQLAFNIDNRDEIILQRSAR